MVTVIEAANIAGCGRLNPSVTTVLSVVRSGIVEVEAARYQQTLPPIFPHTAELAHLNVKRVREATTPYRTQRTVILEAVS